MNKDEEYKTDSLPENTPEGEGGEPEEISCIIEPREFEIPERKKQTFFGMFSGVVKRHRRGEVIDLLSSGIRGETAKLLPPRPWLFIRVFLFMAVVFGALYFAIDYFGNLASLPALVFFGTFALPVSLVLFFFEVDVHRDISVFSVIKMFFFGGVSASFLTFVLYWLIGGGKLDYVGAVLSGVIKETAKLLVILFCVKRYDSRTVLSGLLVGAAVSAGFSSFDAAGAAFLNMFVDVEITGSFGSQTISAIIMNGQMVSESVRQMLGVTVFNHVLAPAAEIAWGAISGAVVLLLDCSRKESGETIKSFYLLFFIPMIFHAVWGMPFVERILPQVYFIPLLLALASWYVIVEIVNYALADLDFSDTAAENKDK